MKDDRLYLIHIIESISRIELYTAEGKDVFLHDGKTQDAVLGNLQTLAESTQHVSASLKSVHPEIDWTRIAALRNVLVHDYLGINLVRIWEIVQRGLPELRNQVSTVLKELGEPAKT